MKKPWIGVDLDGTLAYHDEAKPYDVTGIGPPIPKMLERVKGWLAEGKKVKIFTARVAKGPNKKLVREQIKNWTQHYLGKRLPVTAKKTHDMTEFWDDRAVQVSRNTGKTFRDVAEEKGSKR